MPDNIFRAKPGRFGTQIVEASFSHASTLTLTANSSNLVYVPTPPSYCRLAKLSLLFGTKAADADGTIVATAYRYAAGSSDATLTSALDTEATLTAKVPSSFTISGTETQRRFNKTGNVNTLVVDLRSNSASIDTQPVDVFIVAEFEILA
jgi:hypothetical protein